jgi:hypothetical protein
LRSTIATMQATSAVFLIALTVPIAACDASVDQFTASAHYICSGQQVQLTWRVTGSGTMRSVPPLASLPDGPVADNGQATVAPATTTNVELHVTRFLGHPTSSTQELRVLSASPTPEPLGVSIADPSAGCSDGKVWATVHPQHFSGDLKVETVASHTGDGHTYDVRHAGLQGTLTPGSTATQFAGLPIMGDWVLVALLLPGETCGTPTVPRSLIVDVFTQCVPGDAR